MCKDRHARLEKRSERMQNGVGGRCPGFGGTDLEFRQEVRESGGRSKRGSAFRVCKPQEKKVVLGAGSTCSSECDYKTNARA